ncbi:MAG: hypothetical protein KDB07_07830, partial [Planctomycetes bacterium]|nr:hypothetical protein [Planctomycetota bacterium]
VVVNKGEIPPSMILKYEAKGSVPVDVDTERLHALGGDFQIIEADLVNADDVVRHDPDKLSRAILSTYREIVKEQAKQKSTA